MVNQLMERTVTATDSPLVRMAQQASKDESLMAAHIKRYGEREGLSWVEIGRQLQLDSIQLARLALCRAPRRSRYSQDLKQIASYAGVKRPALQKILQQNGQQSMVKKSQPIWQQINRSMNGLFQRRAWSLSFAVVFLFILGAVAFAQPKPAQAATLVVLQGEAIVMQNQVLPVSDADGQQMVAAGRALTVNAGDEISLGAGATAQLRMFDGSTVDLSENTLLQVTELQTSEDKYRVGLNMLAGKTLSRVVRLLGVGDAFKISTPSSTASVRGTVFTVEVLSPESTYVRTDEGTVWVEMEDQQVEVHAGYEVTAVLGETLDVQSQTEEAPVIVAEAPVAAPAVESPPPADQPPVDDAPPAAPPEVEAPAATPAVVERDADGRVDNVIPAVPADKDQDKRPPVIFVDNPPLDADGNPVVSSTDGDGNDGLTPSDQTAQGGRPDEVPRNNTNYPPEGSNGNPPTAGGGPPGQENKDNPNSGNSTTTGSENGNNKKDKPGK